MSLLLPNCTYSVSRTERIRYSLFPFLHPSLPPTCPPFFLATFTGENSIRRTFKRNLKPRGDDFSSRFRKMGRPFEKRERNNLKKPFSHPGKRHASIVEGEIEERDTWGSEGKGTQVLFVSGALVFRGYTVATTTT